MDALIQFFIYAKRLKRIFEVLTNFTFYLSDFRIERIFGFSVFVFYFSFHSVVPYRNGLEIMCDDRLVVGRMCSLMPSNQTKLKINNNNFIILHHLPCIETDAPIMPARYPLISDLIFIQSNILNNKSTDATTMRICELFNRNLTLNVNERIAHALMWKGIEHPLFFQI